MKTISFKLMSTVALLCCASWAHAAITCTAPVSSGFSTAYAPTGVVPNVTQGTVSFTCTRGVAGDATSLLLRATNGLNPSGGSNNRAALAGSFIFYEGYRDSTCTQLWTSNTTATSLPITLAPVLTPQAVNLSYWGCITTAGQIAPAGTYTDTVTMEVRKLVGGAPYSSGTFTVSITNPATCSITTLPLDLTFNYTSFSAVDILANSTFQTTCTSLLPYTVSLDATAGVVAGINYSLALNTTGSGGVNPLSSVGTGVAQNFFINGTILAGQGGICATATCPGTQLRTLTITY